MIRKDICSLCENPELIENYSKAVNDKTQMWECHHRRETEEDMTMQELKDNNLYYKRPANELIFLTTKEHGELHRGRNFSEEHKQNLRNNHAYFKGEKNPMYGKNIKDYMTEEAYNIWKTRLGRKGKENKNYGKPLTQQRRKNISNSLKGKMGGENNPCFDKKLMNNGIVNKYISKTDIELYINNGWVLGNKKRRRL